MDSNGENQSVRCVIGLDVGGSKIAGGIVLGPNGHVFARKTIPTRAERGGEPVLADTVALAKELAGIAAAEGLDVRGVGIVVCELVDLNGNITSDKTVQWRDVPVRERFKDFGPVAIDADVRGAALAEGMFGAGRGLELFVYVTVGTGISYTLVQAGKPYAGARGNAMLFGNSPLGVGTEIGGSESAPLLEDIASGPAIVANYNRAASKNVNGAEQVLGAMDYGDQIAAKVVRQAADALGMGVGFLVNVLDPEAVIVGGGLGLAGGVYWERFVESTRRHLWSDTNRNLPILKGTLGTDAAMIGAAVLARRLLSESE